MVFAEADDFKNLIQPLQEVARKFKTQVLVCLIYGSRQLPFPGLISKCCMQIMFIYIDIADENLAKPFLTLYGLEDSENIAVSSHLAT